MFELEWTFYKGSKIFGYTILAICVWLSSCNGHAIFWEPPSRASLGNHNMNFCNVPINSDHMSLYCGGIGPMHQQYGGKCGACGDPFGAENQPHVYPGKYATGIIGQSYSAPGQVINVIIDVLADHMGFMAFRLCPNNNPTVPPTPECFEKHQLFYANGDKYYFLESGLRIGTRLELQVKLPDGLECWQCIIQWTYVAGNNWGFGPQMADFATEACMDTSIGAKGCGPQETFRGCADVCIGPRCTTEVCSYATPFPGVTTTTETPTTVTPIITPSVTPTTTTTTTVTPIGQIPIYDQICVVAAIKENFYSVIGTQYCVEICQGKPMKVCNLYICYCVTGTMLENLNRCMY